MTINEMIAVLQKMKKEFADGGKQRVLVASDEEGNTLNVAGEIVLVDMGEGKIELAIYPNSESVD